MMREPIKPTDWHTIIAPTRLLLQTVEEPLVALWELFQANEQALAALEPPLGVVDFAPFAHLAVSGVDPQPAQAKPAPRRSSAHSSATSLLPTAGPPPIPASAPAAHRGATVVTLPNLAIADATPVFALPGRKSALAAVTSVATSHPPAQPLAPAAHQSGLHQSAYAATPVNPASAWQGDPRTVAQPTTQRVPESPASPAPAVTANGEGDRGVPMATMALLATLTDALFTLPVVTGPVVGGGEHSTGVGSHDMGESRAFSSQSRGLSMPVSAQGQVRPAPPLDFFEGNADNALAIQSFAPATRITALSSQAETLPRPGVDDGWLAAPPLATSAALSQPDGWTLAQLINDVLAEEARRHGVDLS